MKLSARLALWFAAMLLVALALDTTLAYREMVIEQGSGHPEAVGEGPEPVWWQFGEVVLRSMIPLALLGAGAWWLTVRALRPLQTLTTAASRIHEGNLRERIPLPDSKDELQKLTAVFNDMTARLELSFDRIREFTLHASHELKTPLAIMRADLGELIDEPGRSASDRERFASHLDEIERLTRIVDGLTLLTRADAQQVPLRRESVALDALVREAAENAQALAEPRMLRVLHGNMAEGTVYGDRHRLRQLLLILCDNAVKYNRPGGEISFELQQKDGSMQVRVRNTGAGIPASDQARVFERFYRGSSAVSDGVDGCGLGLSIATWIAREHGGTLTFTSTPERTEFVFAMPMVPAQAPGAAENGILKPD
jgi:signal transduction histidine kinase